MAIDMTSEAANDINMPQKIYFEYPIIVLTTARPGSRNIQIYDSSRIQRG